MSTDPKPVSAETVPVAEPAATPDAAELSDAELETVAGGISGRVGGATSSSSSSADVPTTQA